MHVHNSKGKINDRDDVTDLDQAFGNILSPVQSRESSTRQNIADSSKENSAEYMPSALRRAEQDAE